MSDETTDEVNVRITGSVTGLVASMAEGAAVVREGTEAMASSFEAMSGAIEAAMAPLLLLTALLEGGELFRDAIEKTTEFGKALEIGGQKMGMAGEELSKLSYAANLSDVSFEQLSTAMTRLARNMEEAGQGGASPAADAFKALGIAVTDSAGHLRPLDDVMLQVAGRFATMEDGAGKTALAINLFGRAGADLIPLLNQGAGGIKALEAEADRLGVTMSGQDIDATNKYVDTMKEFHAVMDALEKNIALTVIPTLTKLATWAEKGAEAMIRLLEKIRMLKPDLTSALDRDPSLDHALGLDQHIKAPSLPSKGGPSQLDLWKEEWDKRKEAELGGDNDLLVMEIFFWKQKLALAAAGSKEYIEVHSHLVDLETQLAKRSDEEDAKAQKELQARWLATFAEIPRAWNSAIQSMRGSTASFGQFFGEVMREITGAALAAEARILIAHNATWLEKKKKSLEGAAEEVATSVWSTLKVVANYAYQAAAAAWAAIAGIPVVGPYLAPIAAAATLAGVLALAHGGGGGAPSAGGAGAKSSASAGGASGSGGKSQTVIIQAMDAQSFHQFAQANAPAFGKAVITATKQGLKLPTSAGRG